MVGRSAGRVNDARGDGAAGLQGLERGVGVAQYGRSAQRSEILGFAVVARGLILQHSDDMDADDAPPAMAFSARRCASPGFLHCTA